MNIDFAEFDKIPSLRAKRDALDKAIEAESEVIQVAFRQNRNEARAIIDRIDKFWDEKQKCRELLSQHENPRWYKSPYFFIGIGVVIIILKEVVLGFRILEFLGLMLILSGFVMDFRSAIERNHYSRNSNDAEHAEALLEFRWRSLGNYSTIFFFIFHKEQERFYSLQPLPSREAFLEVWSYTANEWLNTERTILNELTQRHSPYDSDWRNELDASKEDYLKKIKN